MKSIIISVLYLCIGLNLVLYLLPPIHNVLITEYVPPKTGTPPDGDGSGSRT